MVRVRPGARGAPGADAGLAAAEGEKPAVAPLSADLQDLPVEALKNVGVQTAAVLRSRGVTTAGELLAHLPRRYLDLRNADDWRLIRHGAPGVLVSVEGRVDDARRAGPPNARRLMVAVTEPRGTTVLRAVFFHAHAGLLTRAQVGDTVRLVGTLRRGPAGPELVQPRLLSPDARLRPIEPAYGSIGTLGAGTLVRILDAALALAGQWADPVPPEVSRALGLISSAEALRALHRPDPRATPADLAALTAGRSPAHRRLGFEELLALTVALERARRMGGGARVFPVDGAIPGVVGTRLGIQLTRGQHTAITTLQTALAQTRPMRTLLVGEVGSGKTAVALAASLAVLRQGGSVAWLCPTTLVTEQHARTLERGLAGEGGPVAVLVGSLTARARRKAVALVGQGLVRMVVGTHALLEAGATPPGVGLIVIDEQHRFGVAQRLALVAGRVPSPHLLVLSATPIPRSLALARHGDLEVVTLPEKPPGRQPVATRVVNATDRAYVIKTLERALAAGGRAFVVVPRIDAEEGVGTGIAEADAWLGEALGRDRIAVVHGRMAPDAQHQALEAFRRGTHPILLGTTVVEVGLDVPAANLMVILGAEQFGIAQLHQLRGRVGRGGQKAGCVLVREDPSEEATARLSEVAGCDDGFALAERDLARRGAGEWFGARQSGGDATLHFGDPVRDPDLAAAARDAARALVRSDPDLERHPALARAVRRLLQRGAAPVAEEAG